MKIPLIFAGIIGVLMTTAPAIAQSPGAYYNDSGRTAPSGYGPRWSGSDDIGDKVERPTAPEEYESTDQGRNVPLSQRVDPENPESPSMSGTAD